MNRWLITPSVLAIVLAASVPPTADTQERGEGGIVILHNGPIYDWGQSAAASTEVQAKKVWIGQTIEQVDQTAGAPQKILKAGARVTYVYQDVKVIFEDGEVAGFE